MNQSKLVSSKELQSEVSRLTEELQMRDQLVQQLSQELFRLVKGNSSFVPPPSVADRNQAQMQAMREQLQAVEEQVGFYQEQIAERDAEVYQLRQSVQELTDRSRMLEQVVQELPGVYRQKFAERIEPIKEKLDQLQKENRQLHTELQSVTYRLAVRSRKAKGLDLPSVDETDDRGIQMPSFGNV